MVQYVRLNETGTSVKAIGVLEEPTPTKSGVCDFLYRPQYSVFDWGKMPMPVGALLDNRPVALVAADNYERIKELGFATCYLGAVDDEGNAHPVSWFKANKKIPQGIRVKMVNVLKPWFNEETKKWEYGDFKNPPVNNYVLPLEFIWRQEAGSESSFWKNIKRGVYTRRDFGLSEGAEPGCHFHIPLLDHSSKYEDHDRYFAPTVAQELSGLSEDRWGRLAYIRQVMNDCLSRHAREIGIMRPDGKQEFAVIADNGSSREALADVAGTWHEDRFEYTTKQGVLVKISKQSLRDLNKILNADWAQECDGAKVRAEIEGLPRWKHLVTKQPVPIEAAFFEQYNNLMYAATNAWVGWTAFSEASPLEEACVEFDKYFKDYKARLEKK